MTIGEWLQHNTANLEKYGIKSARLDCLILLEYITKRDKAWLLANQDISLDEYQLQKLAGLITKRRRRWPIAYLVQSKKFGNLDLYVDKNVLIPRPETETILEYLDYLINNKLLSTSETISVVDIGSGSGAIALNIKHKYPEIHVTATDTQVEALAIAKNNATKYSLEIDFVNTNLLDGLASYNAIIANLPYVDRNWSVSPETAFEPPQALYAGQRGLELIYKLISQAKAHLKPDGYIILEHDHRQQQPIADKASDLGYNTKIISPFITSLSVKAN